MGSLHIKNMDEAAQSGATFTGRLHAHLRTLENPKADLILNIDGPYGPALEFEPSILLIAGGIGITPMRSMFRFVVQRAQELAVKRIHLVWSAKSGEEVFDIFASGFLLPQTNRACDVKFSLYCSTAGTQAVGSLGPIIKGRPNISEVIEQEAKQGDRVLVRVCGPSCMVTSCDEAVTN